MELSNLVACICEGSAEKAIMRLLLENDRLIFKTENLLDEDVLNCIISSRNPTKSRVYSVKRT